MGSWRLDVALTQLHWDDASAQLLGRSEVARYASTSDVVRSWTHPDDRAQVLKGWGLCAQTATPHRARFRTLFPDGQYRYCLAYGQRIVTTDGGVHLVGILHPDAAT